jgi:hypothetical protein
MRGFVVGCCRAAGLACSQTWRHVGRLALGHHTLAARQFVVAFGVTRDWHWQTTRHGRTSQPVRLLVELVVVGRYAALIGGIRWPFLTSCFTWVCSSRRNSGEQQAVEAGHHGWRRRVHRERPALPGLDLILRANQSTAPRPMDQEARLLTSPFSISNSTTPAARRPHTPCDAGIDSPEARRQDIGERRSRRVADDMRACLRSSPTRRSARASGRGSAATRRRLNWPTYPGRPRSGAQPFPVFGETPASRSDLPERLHRWLSGAASAPAGRHRHPSDYPRLDVEREWAIPLEALRPSAARVHVERLLNLDCRSHSSDCDRFRATSFTSSDTAA